MKQFMFLAFFLLPFNSFIFGQISQHTLPYSFSKKNIIKTTDSKTVDDRVVDLPGINLVEILKEHEETANSNRFAVAMQVNLRLDNSGDWYDLPNGDRIWILKVKAGGAKSLHTMYKRFYLPEGATLHVYNESKSTILGAFTSVNNKKTGNFATGIIKDDNLIFEYYEPFHQQGNGIIEIDRIDYGYKNGTSSPSINKSVNIFGDAGACNININCTQGNNWQDEKKGVARILMSSTGYSYWCTGSLINNTNNDGTNYFLTASHCTGISTSDYSQWIFYFNYEAAGCSNPGSEPTSNSITGATQKSRNENTDFLLLELSSTIPTAYDVYYNGWDRGTTAASSTIGIHHPKADIKKICIDNQSPNITGYSSVGGSTYWQTEWDEGTTEGGSSGSPLLNSAGLIVGQLHGGYASCSNLSGKDYYGRISGSWTGGGTNTTRLSNWLDPTSSGAMTVNGSGPPAILPTCNQITAPVNSATNISNTSSLSWGINLDATGYKLKIGTTAGAADFLAQTDVGNVFSYQPSDFNYSTTYYVTLIPYSTAGDAVGCTSTSFTSETNLNYGGGTDGTDPNQMNSGGYYFANSISGANANASQPSYNWVDPVGAAHTEITTWTSGNDNDGYLLIPTIGFDFPFWGINYNTNAYINSNGAVTFGTATDQNGQATSIPSDTTPNSMIAGCLMNLDDGTDGKIYYGGDASQFIVTWWHYHDYNDDDEYITFQIILYPNGTIKIQYNDTESTADDGTYTDILNDALVGIENSAGSKGIQYRNYGKGADMFSSPLAVAFSTDNSALPVEMTSFTAKQKGVANVLDWSTASEKNNAHFYVERSINSIDFEVIGEVEGNGTTVEVSNYNFVDKAPAAVSYYRLRQVDFNNNYEYSKIVVVEHKRNNNTVFLYPVPVRYDLTVQYNTTTNEEMIITVIDIIGRTLITKTVMTTEGENQFKINLNTLPSGSYFIRLQSNTNNIVHSIIKE